MAPFRLSTVSFALYFLLTVIVSRTECLRFKRSEVETFGENTTKEMAEERDAQNNDGLQDFLLTIKSYNERRLKPNENTTENEESSGGGGWEFYDNSMYNVHSSMNWRKGRSFTEKLGYLLSQSKMTDCSFIVGPEGGTVKIGAHKVILATASPIFEYAFENNSEFRVKEWQPVEFERLLKFIYSGNLCFSDIEEACAILIHATILELDGASEASRQYINQHMYRPDHLWQVYQCAKNAGDATLLESAKKLIREIASQCFKDHKFNDLSQDDLAEFLTQDDLNVKSEVDVFEAITSWGLVQVTKTGQTPTPELIREKIGPTILKQIRFLTMTGVEFSRIHTSTQLLTYEEGLAILLNINNPGIIKLPPTLSSQYNKRKNKEIVPRTFSTENLLKNTCKESANYEFITTLAIPIEDEAWTIYGIQIPKSIEAKQDCDLIEEHFDVLILDSLNRTMYTFNYHREPPCTCNRVMRLENDNMNEVNDDELIDIEFRPTLDSYYLPSGIYKVKVVFKDKKTYPYYVYAGSHFQSNNGRSKYELYDNAYVFMGDYRKYRLLHNPSFVYAVITD